jgi:putative ABC transport system substrate-binding protein
MVRLNVDAIVTHGTPAALAAKQVTNTIPIVMAAIADAEASGVVASLARPGGNVTGLTFFNPELAAKRLELLKETLPGLTDVGILLNPVNPMNEPIIPAMRSTAESLQLKLSRFGAREPGEFEAAFTEMAAKRVGAVVIIDDATLIANAPALAQIALRNRLPSSGWPDYAVAGGLLSYGINFPDMFRRAATFVDKILKGAKPSDLPVERSTKFGTIVNLKTAKALGIEVSTSILLRADEVIE